MISNLFRTPLYIFWSFVFRHFWHFWPISTCIDMPHPPIVFWVVHQAQINSKRDHAPMHPISNVLDTIMHMVRIHMSALTHFFDDRFGHVLALFDQYLGHSDQISISSYPLPLFWGCRSRWEWSWGLKKCEWPLNFDFCVNFTRFLLAQPTHRMHSLWFFPQPTTCSRRGFFLSSRTVY
jgi:hypothetical protein